MCRSHMSYGESFPMLSAYILKLDRWWCFFFPISTIACSNRATCYNRYAIFCCCCCFNDSGAGTISRSQMKTNFPQQKKELSYAWAHWQKFVQRGRTGRTLPDAYRQYLRTGWREGRSYGKCNNLRASKRIPPLSRSSLPTDMTVQQQCSNSITFRMGQNNSLRAQTWCIITMSIYCWRISFPPAASR